MKTQPIFSLGTLFVCTALTALPTLVSAQSTPRASSATGTVQPRMRLRIAVDQLKWEEMRNDVQRIPADVREGIQSILIEKLVRSGTFEVMEREQTARQGADDEAAIDAQNRAQSPDGGASRMARKVRVAANYLITPTVIGFTVKKSGVDIKGLFGTRYNDSKETAILRLNIRISDAQTSTLIDSETQTGEQTCKSSGIELSRSGIDFGSKKYQESAAGKAVEEALEKAVGYITKRLANEKWTATVMKQDENTGRVIINAGSSHGVQAGMELRVYRRSGGVVDDDGMEIPGDEVSVGVIRVERVENKYAYATVLSGKGFRKGDVTRLETTVASR